MDIIKAVEHEQLKNTVPVLSVGNTVRVSVKIKEGEKERIQVFEGIIIKKQGGGLNETFTVRKISYGVGVEKTFLLHSPMVEKVEVVRVGKARRAKLNYLRDRIGKDAKTKEKVGARIENEVIVLKEDTVEESTEATENVEENVETAEVTEAVETVSTVEEVKEESVEEVKAEPTEEIKAEEVKEKENVEAVEETASVETAEEKEEAEDTEKKDDETPKTEE